MKQIWLALLILFMAGCQSTTESSFQSLNQAFISWYYRFHPVEATRFGMEKYHDNFRLVGNSEIEEHVADISRFIIELSQIDPTKLSSEVRVDYHILFNQLEKMRYAMNNIRPWEWNPLWILDEISDGLFLLSDRPEIIMNIRVKAIQGRLDAVPQMLNGFKEMMVSHSPLHIEYGNRRIEGILHLIDQLPLKMNSDNLTLDEVDQSILICKDALLNFQKWLNQDAVSMPMIQFPIDLKLLDKAFSHFVGEKYLPSHVYRLADKKRTPVQNRIFNLALPIYLEDNDEPVWLDRDDTLEVIQWTIDHIRNNPENKVPGSGILSHFYKSISSLENFIGSKRLIPKHFNKRVKLAFAPEYIQSNDFVHLFNHQPNKFNSEIIYFIKDYEDVGGFFPLSSYEIDLLNARYIIPGQSVQIANAQQYSSPIRYMFPDPINKAGWQIYAMQMILDAEFEHWNDVYHILKLKEEVMVICQTIIEGNYYSGEMNREDALLYVKKQAFLSDNEAEALMVQSELNYFSGSQALIGIVEINSLLTEFKKNQDNNFHISSFHNIVLKDGIIPLYELKKQIF